MHQQQTDASDGTVEVLRQQIARDPSPIDWARVDAAAHEAKFNIVQNRSCQLTPPVPEIFGQRRRQTCLQKTSSSRSGGATAGDRAVSNAPSARRDRRGQHATRAVLLVVGLTLAVSVTSVSIQRPVDRWLTTPLPTVPSLSIYSIFNDQTPVDVTITAAWQKVHLTMPADTLRSDVTLWRQMNFDDWDKIPSDLREEALHAMWKRYRGLIGNPRQWDQMEAHDWDLIPQPIRAMAYIGMIRYWSGYYQVGGLFGLPRGAVTNTMSAIVMAESWFEHRGSYTNPDGDRDIGLGGSSAYCRRTLDRLYREKVIDFTLTEEDYFDPWQAARVVAVWFQLMLEETSGDLDAAVRAYHRGSPSARLGEGEEYLANVKKKRRRFMRNEDSTPAWEFLFVRAAEQERSKTSYLLTVDNDNQNEG